MSNNRFIAVDGVEYEIDRLPTEIKALIARHETWSEDKTKALLDYEKADLALQTLTQRIQTDVRTYVGTLAKQAMGSPVDPPAPASDAE